MDLNHWLEEKGISLAAFGQMIGKSAPTVSRLVHGQGNTDSDTLLQIERVTKGAVTATDILRAKKEGAA